MDQGFKDALKDILGQLQGLSESVDGTPPADPMRPDVDESTLAEAKMEGDETEPASEPADGTAQDGPPESIKDFMAGKRLPPMPETRSMKTVMAPLGKKSRKGF